MKKSIACFSFAFLGVNAYAVEPQEVGKVISSKQITHQIQIPQQICGTTPVAINEPKSGAGAMMGAITGAAVGSSVGQGGGNAAATALGMVGGAVLGDKLEGQNTIVQNTTTCTTQFVTQNITMYEVEYIYAGKRYKATLPNDPGKTIPVSVSPAYSTPSEAGVPIPSNVSAQYTPAVMPPAQQVPIQAVPTPVYVNPYPYYGYPYGYYPPFGVHFGVGYYHGYRR
jgi:uncharacterized protein YcfJ